MPLKTQALFQESPLFTFQQIVERSTASGTAHGFTLDSCRSRVVDDQQALINSVLIHRAPMGHPHHQDHHSVIFDPADGSIITDPISPQTRERGFQRFAKHAWIFRGRNSVIEIIQNGQLSLPFEPLQIFEHAPVIFNGPGQVPASSRRS